MAGRDHERIALRGLLPAVRSIVALLVRAYAAHRRRLVFRPELAKRAGCAICCSVTSPVLFFSPGTFSWLSSLGTLFENFLLHGLPFLLSLYLAIYFAFWSWFVGLIRPSEAAASEPEPPNKWDEMLARAGKPAKPAAPSSPWLRSTSNLRLAFCVASAWAAQEWIRGWLFTGFSWNNLGVALHTNWPIIQIAEFTGVAGLSFAVAFANVIAVTTSRRLIIEARTPSDAAALRSHAYHERDRRPARVWHACFRKPNSRRSGADCRRAGQHSAARKIRSAIQGQDVRAFTRLSEIATKTSPPPDLLIWPESSMPGPVLEDDVSNRFVMDLVRSTKTDLLLGSVDVQEPEAYNAALLDFSRRAGRSDLSQDPSRPVWRIHSAAAIVSAFRRRREQMGAGRFRCRQRLHCRPADKRQGAGCAA